MTKVKTQPIDFKALNKAKKAKKEVLSDGKIINKNADTNAKS